MQTHTTSVTVANLEEWRYNSADAHDIGHGGKFKKELGDSSQRGHARPGFGSQGCRAGICSQRSREGLWSLANGPAGCRGGFETGLPNVTFETHKKELGDSS